MILSDICVTKGNFGADEIHDKTDGPLRARLQDEALSDLPITVAVTFHSPSDKAFRSPEQTRALAGNVLEHAAEVSNLHPDKVNVFKNIDTLLVVARPAFVRALLNSEEVSNAMLEEDNRLWLDAPPK